MFRGGRWLASAEQFFGLCVVAVQTTDRNLWISAVSLARRQLGISGFTLLHMGTPLYALAVQIHAGPRFKFSKRTHRS